MLRVSEGESGRRRRWGVAWALARARASPSPDSGQAFLRVEHCETNALGDPAWADCERDGNKEALASKHAAFFRAVFAPTLAGALARDSEVERLRAFSDRLESGLKRRLASEPQPINSLAETIVFAKSGES